MNNFSYQYRKDISGIIHQEADARGGSFNSSEHLLHIEDLKVIFRTAGKDFPAVDKISMLLSAGEHIALLGETGCGKSVLTMALFGLLPSNATVSGTVSGLGYQNILTLAQKKLNKLRGREIVLIPQNPHGSLNPVFRVGNQLAESVRLNHRKKGEAIRKHVHDLLGQTGFAKPERIARMYPHQLSGGMAQRILLAIGLAGTPKLVIADEPTKGLDQDISELCLNLLTSFFDRAAMLLITHDLKAAAVCHKMAVMYAGEIVECGPVKPILSNPCHPYVRGLINAHPSKGLHPIPGAAPALTKFPQGCRFHPRCPHTDDRCRANHPELDPMGDRSVRCFYADC